MKKNWMKKLSAAICAATLFASGFAVTANAEATPGYKITPFGPSNFDDLTGEDLPPITNDTTGKIIVSKYITENQPQNGDKSSAVEPEIPVSGVEFTLVKVGRYANVVAPDGTTSTMIGLDKEFVDIVLEDFSMYQPYIEDEDGYVYMTSNLYNSFNKTMETEGNKLAATIEKSAWWEKLTDTQKTNIIKTDVTGKAEFSYNATEFGIYVVVETDVSSAQANGENVLFSKKQYPYIVSLPYTTQPEDEGGAKWSLTVNAKAKNTETTVDVDKKIERNVNSLTWEMDNQAETDVTHVGDTVEFTLITDVPMIEAHEGVKSYVIFDEVTKGITLPAAFTPDNIVITDSFHVDESGNPTYTYVFGQDYRVFTYTDLSLEDKCTDEDGVDYVDGFKIVFTESGRAKIAEAAHVTNGNQKIYTNYIATINKHAVVGSEGNYNHVKLELQAAGSGTISTGWEYVREFIFTMTGTKTFDSAQNNGLADEYVKFELYLDNPETNKDATALRLIQNDVGDYTYVDPASIDDLPEGTKIVDKISLNKSSFSIKGVPVTLENAGVDVTLYLKETATAPGYNKLTKVIPITLTAKAEGTPSEYDGTLESGTVNKKAVEPIKVDGEGVAVAAGETGGTNSGITFTVNNTKGFQLPSTGGMGIWMFVIGGMAVIGCGLLYYRRNKSAE